uniref:Rho-GAP domain-containing protein n=1 Tax=Labrus bergylta TaxID=56723 RepID=A0A3Q3G4N5_9LABR
MHSSNLRVPPSASTARRYIAACGDHPIHKHPIGAQDLQNPLHPYEFERLLVLREIVKKFPPVNYQVFKYIITHLNRVSQHSKLTLMTPDNLSICFWPTLMRPDFENKDTLSTTKLNQAVIESFIVQSDYFFHGGEVAESSSSEGTPPPHCHNMVEALLPLQLPPPLQPQQIQHTLHPDPLI